MKPVVLTVSIPATVLSCQLQPDHDVAQGPAPDVPELKLLDHYAGQWEDEIAGRPDMRRSELGEWILEGRFLRQTWSTESGDGSPSAHGITLMTFDPQRQVYRSWAFLATGSVIENEGLWDPVTKTFTWGHSVANKAERVITKASFTEKATQSWSIVKTDEHDKVLREVSGRSVRRNVPTLHAA
jgi:hypothetical protein